MPRPLTPGEAVPRAKSRIIWKLGDDRPSVAATTLSRKG